MDRTAEFHSILLSGIADAVFLTDLKGSFLYIHPNVEILFKRTTSEIRRLASVWELLGDMDSLAGEFEKGREVRNVEHDITDGGGRIHTLLINIKTVSVPEDALLFTCRDITERKRMEEVLYASEQRFRSIANNVPGVVTQMYISGNDISIDYISDRSENFFGYSPVELMTNPNIYLDLVRPPYRERLLSKLLETARAALPFTLEYEIQSKPGNIKWVNTSVSPHVMNDGTVRAVAITYDVSKVKQLELEVQEATMREQRRLGQELHDGIAQQIGGITFLSQVLEGKLRKMGLEEAEEAEKITGYLQDLLFQTRQLAAGLYPAIIEREGLATALEELALRTISMYNVNCTFNAFLEDPINVVSVAVHVYRITQEAINNAVTHGKASRIAISLKQEKDWYTLRVADNGIGIGFDTDPPYGGGMGLTTMRNRAVLIGGEARISPVAPSGTEVICTFHI